MTFIGIKGANASKNDLYRTTPVIAKERIHDHLCPESDKYKGMLRSAGDSLQKFLRPVIALSRNALCRESQVKMAVLHANASVRLGPARCTFANDGLATRTISAEILL